MCQCHRRPPPGGHSVTAGCDAEGRHAGLDFDAVFDGGAYAAAKPTTPVNLHGAADCALGYRVPCYTLRSRIAYANTVPKGRMRSPGAPQAVFAVESALDELAAAAGTSPLELRRRNLLEAGVPVPETGTGSHAVIRRQLTVGLGIDPSRVIVRQVPTTALPGDPGAGAVAEITGPAGTRTVPAAGSRLGSARYVREMAAVRARRALTDCLSR